MATRLTAAVVKTAAPGLVFDDVVTGFCLRVYETGAKTFQVNYRVNGRERRVTIGRWPTWTVEAARAQAKELRRLIDAGHDPAQQKRERREAPTVQDLVDRYIAEHLPTKRAKNRKLPYLERTVRYREKDEFKVLDEIATRLGKHARVAEIHGGDIIEMHRALTEATGPIRANRILGICSRMFALALLPRAGENRSWRDQAQGNPCKGVARNREQPRERFFSSAELAAISDALQQYGQGARGGGRRSAAAAADCVRLIMLTGCRPQEARLAQWSEFDGEPGTWVKPSSHMKTDRTHRLPLAPAALELIERLRRKRMPGATWVFPGQRPGQPLQALVEVWKFVRDRAGLGDDARLYDLRHTFASVGAGGGLSLPIIGRLLGHAQSRTTARYAHLADDPVREAAEKIGAVIAGAGKSSAEIVRIPRKG